MPLITNIGVLQQKILLRIYSQPGISTQELRKGLSLSSKTSYRRLQERSLIKSDKEKGPRGEKYWRITSIGKMALVERKLIVVSSK